MTDTERLIRDIHSLRVSIKLDYIELVIRPLSPDARLSKQTHIDNARADLRILLDRLGLAAGTPPL